MLSLDWEMMINWLLRYYFPVLILLPIIVVICLFDRRLKLKNRKTIVALCGMLALLIFVDVVNEPLSRLEYFVV